MRDRPVGPPPGLERVRIGVGDGARGMDRAELALLEHDRAAAGLEELADLPRDLGLGLELEIRVAQRDRDRPGRDQRTQVVELVAEVAALRAAVADLEHAARDGLALDDELLGPGAAHRELDAELVGRAPDRLGDQREHTGVVVGDAGGRGQRVVPRPVELGHREPRLARRLVAAAGADDRARGDARLVELAELGDRVARAERRDRVELCRRERIDRVLVLHRDVERRVQVIEPAHQHGLDLAALALAAEPHRRRIALEPIDQRARQLAADRRVHIIEARHHDHDRRHRVGDPAQHVDRLLQPRDRLAVGHRVLDLIDQQHERGELELVRDRAELLDRPHRVLGLVARGEPAEHALLVARQRLAAQEPDHAALHRRIAALQQQQRVDQVRLDPRQPVGAQDAIDQPADQVVELVARELGVAQPLELGRRDAAAALGEPVRQVEQPRLGELGRVVRPLERVDQVAQHVARVVADLGGHLQVADVAQPLGVDLLAQRAQQVGLAAARIAEHQQRAAVAVLVLLGRGRAHDLAVEHLARVGVDRLDVERIALVDLRAVRDRREHLGPVGAAERDVARVGAGRRRRLEHVAQPAPRVALELAGPAGEHVVHDPHQHALEVAQRRRVVGVALDVADQRQAAPRIGARVAERALVALVQHQEPLGLLGGGRALVERLVARQHREVLGRGDLHQVRHPRDLVGLDLAVELDRHVGHAQAVVEQRELREHRHRGRRAARPRAEQRERLGAHRVAQAAIDRLGHPRQPRGELGAIEGR